MNKTPNKSISFFGNKTALIMDSASKEDPFMFFKCISKKKDGSWEKHSEGKKVKLNLDEIAILFSILTGRKNEWSTYHKYNETQTQISIKWGDYKEKSGKPSKVIFLNINGLSKSLNEAQIELSIRFVDKILDEKIEYSTIYKQDIGKNETESEVEPEVNNNDEVSMTDENLEESLEVNPEEFLDNSKDLPLEKVPTDEEPIKDSTVVKGTIQSKTDKAVLINFLNGVENWVPKSTIHSKYTFDKEKSQNFKIENWLLKKIKII